MKYSLDLERVPHNVSVTGDRIPSVGEEIFIAGNTFVVQQIYTSVAMSGIGLHGVLPSETVVVCKLKDHGE